MSAKMMRETDYGLALVAGAEPSWWAADEEDMMKGLPTPAKVRSWWEERSFDPPETADHADQSDQDRSDPHSYAGSGDRRPADQSPISDLQNWRVYNRKTGEMEPLVDDRQVIGDPPITENGIDKGKTTSSQEGDRRDRADRHFSEDEEFPSVAALFAAPPDWLPAQLKIYRQDPDLHFRPLCASVAALVLGDAARHAEVAEEVRAEAGP
jgi:hypothetical protein